MKKVSIALSCIAAMGLLAGTANAASHGGSKAMKLSDANIGRTIAVTCYGCHGGNAQSKGAAPSLAGMPASHLSSTMKAFKSGSRPASIMNRIAKGYSDADIAAVAKYLSGLK